ncbi:8-amino-7-oxononanoate synthase [Akkermansiaceae bacterium]|nr:8-amino-7-oxononanoate synthase [Akkermansiaceae bacterium]
MEELDHLREKGLLRNLRRVSSPARPLVTIGGRELVNFSSNDYLGLSRHPALIEAASDALLKYGTGSTASRLVCGSLDIYHELEETIAQLKKTEAALSFANGYATAMGTIPALVGKGDTVILDKLSHACLIDAAKLSDATLRVFPHNDLAKLERLLGTATGRVLVVTESVFSMDGDLAPLAEIVELKERFGALLLLDEAHAIGVLGPTGQGLAEALGAQEKVDFQMGTLGKAIGSAGGYLAASQEWIDLLINKARSFIYSTAPPTRASGRLLGSAQASQHKRGPSDQSKAPPKYRSYRPDKTYSGSTRNSHHPNHHWREPSRPRRFQKTPRVRLSSPRHPIPHRSQGNRPLAHHAERRPLGRADRRASQEPWLA